MSIESDLHNSAVGSLDLSEFASVGQNASVREAIDAMRSSRRNCAFVFGEDEQLVGILTDRDVLMKVVTHPERLTEPVTTVMTANPTTATTDDTARSAMGTMQERRFRNIPVVNGEGKVVGNFTHFSIIRFLADNFPELTYNLPPDPNREASDKYGG